VIYSLTFIQVVKLFRRDVWAIKIETGYLFIKIIIKMILKLSGAASAFHARTMGRSTPPGALASGKSDKKRLDAPAGI
jgi:hypothetical protein